MKKPPPVNGGGGVAVAWRRSARGARRVRQVLRRVRPRVRDGAGVHHVGVGLERMRRRDIAFGAGGPVRQGRGGGLVDAAGGGLGAGRLDELAEQGDRAGAGEAGHEQGGGGDSGAGAQAGAASGWAIESHGSDSVACLR